ncbi:concanavalin A-like lectin/glucanase domain-containing protein [Rhizophagus clarus]|uniref:Concanavalin A-like lectin/glucanase domain-containing protein n=1 Tax=Rhizophagus clarus TaxID=94130 RepID=A0A8H3QKK8_9GLOM|nr:concanavalin A-like lectin/glucanase domain-containing protein [Rhizophagus clarus]
MFGLGKVIEQTLTIEIVAEAFHGADYFLLEPLKLQIIEFFKIYLKNNTGNELNLSAKVLPRLLESSEEDLNRYISEAGCICVSFQWDDYVAITSIHSTVYQILLYMNGLERQFLVFGFNGVIYYNTQQENGPYTNKYGKEFKENDKIIVHLHMRERICSFSVNGERYPIAFRNLPDEIHPAVSLREGEN